MTTTTHYAAIQIDTRTVYGIGETADRARDEAAEEGATCSCADDDPDCTHAYGELPSGFALVPCTQAAAAYVESHGGAPSPQLTVSARGVCLRSEEE
jgi:hypothetical protein